MACDYGKKTYVEVGQKIRMEIAYSEAAMHLQVAGKVLEVELRPASHGAVAQIYKDGREYSFPITTGEAGFYQDQDGYYYYPVIEEVRQ